MFSKYQTVHQKGLGKQPFPDGACDRTGLSSSAFQHALAFAKRMNRALTAGDCAKCENNGDSLNRLGTVPFSNAIMSFIVLEKGTFFWVLSTGAEWSEATSRKGSLCALMVIKAIAAKYAGYGRSQPPLVRRGK